MALYGSLREMSVADLIQHNCQDQKTALLTVDHEGKKAQIYFKDGTIVHAALGPIIGEEAVFQALAWEDGKFVLEMGALPSSVSVKRNWSSILLEGAKRMDETREDDPGGGDFSVRRERALSDILISFLTSSKIFRGAVVLDPVGVIKAACLENPSDQEMLASVAAAVINFGNRSLKMTSQGKFFYSIIQGETGCIVVFTINTTGVLVAVAAAKPNPLTMMEELNRVCANMVDFI